jgi:hypothetical protein
MGNWCDALSGDLISVYCAISISLLLFGILVQGILLLYVGPTLNDAMELLYPAS